MFNLLQKLRRVQNVKKNQEHFEYAVLIKEVALKVGDERASKCGFDLMMGLYNGDVKERAKAWRDYLKDYPDGPLTHVSSERDGVWVPAIAVE